MEQHLPWWKRVFFRKEEDEVYDENAEVVFSSGSSNASDIQLSDEEREPFNTLDLE